MRALLLITLLIATGAAAAAQGWWVHFRLAYLLAAVLVLSFVWSWSNLRWLDVTRRTSTVRSQVGGTIEERFAIRNRSFLPKLWLEIRDHSTMPDYRVGVVKSLGPSGGDMWTSTTRATRRGIFRLGPISVRSGDPFGLFTHQRLINAASDIIVYPRTLPLPRYPLPVGRLLRERRSQQQTHEATPHVAGVREHQPGESLSKVHWPTTARTGRYMAREFAVEPSTDIWIVIDGEASAQAGVAPESTDEYAATIAASLAKRFLDEELAVGLVLSGRERRVIDIDRSPKQLIRILEELAAFRADGYQPLAEVLIEEGRRFHDRAGLVIVTPTTDESWVPGMTHLTRRGVGIAIALIEASTFGADESPITLVGALAAAGAPTYMVKRGDALEDAFSTSAR